MNNQLTLFEEPTAEAYIRRAKASKLEGELKNAIQEPDSIKTYKLSRTLGIEYGSSDPVQKLYKEGEAWVKFDEEKQELERIADEAQNIKDFLKEGFHFRGGKQYSAKQAELLAKYFPEESRDKKIYSLLESQPGKIPHIFNATYRRCLKKQKEQV